MLVDLENPVYLTILAKAVRRLARAGAAAAVTVTEMLPAPDQTWLVDDRGERYTAELRFVAVDTAPRADGSEERRDAEEGTPDPL